MYCWAHTIVPNAQLAPMTSAKREPEIVGPEVRPRLTNPDESVRIEARARDFLWVNAISPLRIRTIVFYSSLHFPAMCHKS